MTNAILVTGGSGFIGANFFRYLFEESGFEGRVINFDSLTYAGNPENLADVEERFGDRYAFVRGDIRDAETVRRTLDGHGVDTICHFAAESHVDRSILGPAAFLETNVMGTFTLLEEARRLGDRLLLFHHVSTDEVYGSLGETGLFTETTPYDPSSPYSASKASSDHLVTAYARTYGLPVTISNCSNNYGPYQFPEKLIPLIVLNARDGKELPVYGDGKNVRDWLYVTDHCRAVWTIMQEGRRGETYNVGGRCEMANIDVVHLICDILDDRLGAGSGSRRDLIRFVTDRPGHDRRYAIDCSKLENELGWHPLETFASGMEKTIDWYLANTGWVERILSGAYQEWVDRQYGGTS